MDKYDHVTNIRNGLVVDGTVNGKIAKQPLWSWWWILNIKKISSLAEGFSTESRPEVRLEH